MKLILSKKKLILLKTISILVGLSMSGMSYAVLTNAKSGSFDYIIPDAGTTEKCPSPYDPLVIVLNNKTDYADFNPAVGDVRDTCGNAIWVNIYYVGFDNRPYYGDYLGYNAEQNLAFPFEIKDGRETEIYPYTNTTGSDPTGPILLATHWAKDSTVQGGTYPKKSWTYHPGGLAPVGFELLERATSANNVESGTTYDELVKDPKFGKYTKVFTIDNIPNNTGMYSVDGKWDTYWKTNDSVTLPMRSFSRIRIEVRVGLTSKPVSMAMPRTDKDRYATSEVVARWDAHAVSNKNGYMLQVDKSWVKSSDSGLSGTSNFSSFGSSPEMKTGGVLNILPADALVITMKGTWKYYKVKNFTGTTVPDSNFFDGSKIVLSSLKMRKATEVDGRPMSSASGQNLVTCN